MDRLGSPSGFVIRGNNCTFDASGVDMMGYKCGPCEMGWLGRWGRLRNMRTSRAEGGDLRGAPIIPLGPVWGGIIDARTNHGPQATESAAMRNIIRLTGTQIWRTGEAGMTHAVGQVILCNFDEKSDGVRYVAPIQLLAAPVARQMVLNTVGKKEDGLPCAVSLPRFAKFFLNYKSHSCRLSNQTFGCKYPQKVRRPALSKDMFAAAATAIFFGSHLARAQPFLHIPTPLGWSESVPHSTEYCKQSTLSGTSFIRLIDDIVDHGDLTDVSFIESKLGARFSMSYGLWNGNPDLKKLDYQSNSMLNEPVQVILHINIDRPKKGDRIAFISFNGDAMTASNPTFISNCLHMSPYDFSAAFGTGFFSGIPIGGVPSPGEPAQPPASVGATKNLDNVGKGGSRFELNIEYSPINLTVSQVAIAQYQ